jgi:prenylcysteine oxidase/farnesylcysteine lyase
MRINATLVTASAALLGLVFAQDEPSRQIAIIGWVLPYHSTPILKATSNLLTGAGAAGSSAAYFLQKFAGEAGVNVNVTLFEKTDRIGGRSLTIDAFDDPAQRVEQGASIFIPANHVLYGAMNEFGFTPSAASPGVDPVVGIWDGDRFVFKFDRSAPSWLNNIRVILKYGLTSPQRTQELTNATISKFLGLYDPKFFPFQSLTQRAQELDLVEATSVTGEQFLSNNGVSISTHEAASAADKAGWRPLRP